MADKLPCKLQCKGQSVHPLESNNRCVCGGQSRTQIISPHLLPLSGLQNKKKQSTELYNFSSVKDSINFHFIINVRCYSLQEKSE